MAYKLDRDGTVWGVILIALGAIFLIQKIFNVEILSQIWQFWPILLIIWGILILRDRSSSRK